jgi:hypothetical protein
VERAASRVLKVHSRRAGDVPAIDEQQIEQEEDERSLAGVAGILDEVEGRPAIRQHAADFSVEVGGVGRQVDDGLRDAGVFLGPVVAPARQDLNFAGVEPGVHPIPVKFDLVQPV